MTTTTEARADALRMQCKTVTLSVNRSERACLNCAYYEQYYRQNRGNIRAWVPVCAGYCIRHDCRRGPLRQPCREFTSVLK